MQELLEEALSRVAAESITTAVSGRTDAGVHATNQVFSFRTNAQRVDASWLQGANAHLPADIAVHSIQRVDERFHARFSAARRRYFYVFGESAHTPAFGSQLANWTSNKLDADQLDNACSVFLGEHDFSTFAGSQDTSSSRCRDVQRIHVLRSGNFVVLDITANAFLYKMVRNVAGTLLAIAQGKIRDSDLACLLDAKDRTKAPATASAKGLYLVQIIYENYPALSRLRIPQLLGHKFEAELHTEKELQISFVRPSLSTSGST